MRFPSFSTPQIPQLILGSVSRRYMVYVIMAGAVWGMIGFGEVIARKSLNASGLQITLYVMSFPIASLTSIWWARLLAGKSQRKLLLLVGAIGAIGFFTGVAVSTFLHFFIFHAVFFMALSILGPAENRVLQQHVPSDKTGSTFGKAFGLRMGMAAGFSALAGIWMDRVPEGYRYLYPLVAIIVFFNIRLLSSIPTRRSDDIRPDEDLRYYLVAPFVEVVKLLKRRKDYLRFEIGFMIYGVAFMMTLPVVPLYLVDDLQLGYDTIGLARGALSQLVMIPAIPLFGKLFDRSTPHRMSGMIFPLLALYPVLLLSAQHFEGTMRIAMVYVSFAYFGIVMSGIMVLWNLSSMRFAAGEDAGIYQSVHVTATGIRGSFAPLLGLLVMNTMGKTTTLYTASVIWILGGFIMYIMRLIDKRSGNFVSLRAVEPDLSKKY